MSADGQRSPFRRVLRVVGAVALVGAAALLVVALVPSSPGNLASEPDPAPDYTAAKERFDRLAAAEGPVVYPPCRSRLIDHGSRTDTVVVLVHGLTNCPQQFLELGERIHATGATVLIMRVPRHGLKGSDGGIGGVDQLDGISAAELRDYADEVVDIADGLGEDRRVLGLSMGGVITSWIAQNRDVDQAVVVSPALTLPAVPSWVDTLFRNLFSRLPNIPLISGTKVDHAYPGESTKALTAMYQLAQYTVDEAKRERPAAESIVVVTNANDNQIRNADVYDLTDAWRARGAAVTTYEFPAEEGLPHDLIDPQQPDGDIERVYPVLLRELGIGS